MAPALLAVLDSLERLLAEQAQALLQGEADALPGLAEQLRQGLALLARTAGRAPLSPECRERVTAMLQRTQSSLMMLARRQRDVEQSLANLGAGHAGLQAFQAGSVYGARGGLAANPWRSRGFERA